MLTGSSAGTITAEAASLTGLSPEVHIVSVAHDQIAAAVGAGAFDGCVGEASIFQPKLGVGLKILFNAKDLDGFVEWKMMGVRDYVLGLECGNCYPDGRDVMRRTGMLKFLKAGEKKTYSVKVEIFHGEDFTSEKI